MPRQDKLTSKFKIWRNATVVAIIDAPDYESAHRYALRKFGPKCAVAWVE